MNVEALTLFSKISSQGNASQKKKNKNKNKTIKQNLAIRCRYVDMFVLTWTVICRNNHEDMTKIKYFLTQTKLTEKLSPPLLDAVKAIVCHIILTVV